jgi:hypothetical protein
LSGLSQMGCGASSSAPQPTKTVVGPRPSASVPPSSTCGDGSGGGDDDSVLVLMRWRALLGVDAAGAEARRLEGQQLCRLSAAGASCAARTQDAFQRAAGGLGALAAYERVFDTWVEPPRDGESGERLQRWSCGRCGQVNEFEAAPRACQACRGLRTDLPPALPLRREQLGAEREAVLEARVANLVAVAAATNPAAVRCAVRRRLITAIDLALPWLASLNVPMSTVDVAGVAEEQARRASATRADCDSSNKARRKREATKRAYAQAKGAHAFSRDPKNAGLVSDESISKAARVLKQTEKAFIQLAAAGLDEDEEPGGGAALTGVGGTDGQITAAAARALSASLGPEVKQALAQLRLQVARRLRDGEEVAAQESELRERRQELLAAQAAEAHSYEEYRVTHRQLHATLGALTFLGTLDLRPLDPSTGATKAVGQQQEVVRLLLG